MSQEDIASKLELLQYIPRYILEELAQKYGLPKSGRNEELRIRIAEKVPFEIIEEIYEKFEDAGNVTIHLFKFEKEFISRLIDAEELEKFLVDLGLLDVFGKKKEVLLTSEHQIVLIKRFNGKIKIKTEAKGERIIKRDAETRKVISFSPIIPGTAILHLDSGLVEIRVRSRKMAKKICDKLAEIFNNAQEYEAITFTEEEIDQIIRWASKLRNATIKPLSGRISSLRITAAQHSDLREEGIYKNREEFIGECIRTGVYIQYKFKTSRATLLVGLQINSQQGKLFFKTYVSEEVIDHVLSKIKEIKKL